MDKHLIVVSNRLPFVLRRSSSSEPWCRRSSAGGLVTAVAPVVSETGGSWVGWPGVPLGPKDKIPEADASDKSPTAGLGSEQIFPVALTSEEAQDLFYNTVCNGVLWPIFHMMPEKAEASLGRCSEAFGAYRLINDLFAQEALKAARSSSRPPLIWIHDYHLLLVGKSIREALRDSENGSHPVLSFFLHIPFPAPDIFRILPWSEELLEAMLCYDLLGFHSSDYGLRDGRMNEKWQLSYYFLQCVERFVPGVKVDFRNGEIERHDGSIARVVDLPIGIPYDAFEDLARRAPQKKDGDKKMRVILGVDRLDYTKGIPKKLRAFDRFLEKYPEHHGKVQMLQVAVPSRTGVGEYKELEHETNCLVTWINGTFAEPDWVPVNYLHKTLGHEQLAGLYRDADVALLTPLRDGMNLVAKEFVAARVNEPGVLVLSTFTGVSKHMPEAVAINPYDEEATADAIHRALTMDEGEKKERMQGLQQRERGLDVHKWMEAFLEEVQAMDSQARQRKEQAQEKWDKMLGDSVRVGKGPLVLLLDFDGTIAPIVDHPSKSKLPHASVNLLESLTELGGVEVAIISGRGLSDLKDKVGMANITLSGNHGRTYEFKDGTSETIPLEPGTSFDALKAFLQTSIIDKHPGTWIEDKRYSLTVHFRQTAESLQDEIRRGIQDAAQSLGMGNQPGHCSVECLPRTGGVDKGVAVKHILENLEIGQDAAAACVIYIGDDTTDEDAIAEVNKMGRGITFRVVSGGNKRGVETGAKHVLGSTREVSSLLAWLLQVKKEADFGQTTTETS